MGPLLPLAILFGGMHLLQQRKDEAEAKHVSAQPRYSSAAISAVTSETPEGVRVFRVLPPTTVFAACSLEPVDVDGAAMPDGVLVFKLVPLAFGAETADHAIAQATAAGYLVLGSLSVVLSPVDAAVDQLIVIGEPDAASRIANSRGIFAVLAFPEAPKVTEPATSRTVGPEVVAEVVPQPRNGIVKLPEKEVNGADAWVSPAAAED